MQPNARKGASKCTINPRHRCGEEHDDVDDDVDVDVIQKRSMHRHERHLKDKQNGVCTCDPIKESSRTAKTGHVVA